MTPASAYRVQVLARSENPDDDLFMTTPDQPGWYDDPGDANAQRYWDGQDWTPHRQRKPASKTAQPSAMPTAPHQPSSPPNLPPPPAPDQQSQGPPPGQAPNGVPPRRSRAAIKVVGAIGAVAALAVAGVLVLHQLVRTNNETSPEGPGSPGQTSPEDRGGAGAKSESYQKGFDVSSRSDPRSFVSSGMSISGVCKDAYNTDKMLLDPDTGEMPDLNETEYMQGCTDGFKSNPVTSPPSGGYTLTGPVFPTPADTWPPP